MAAKTEARIDVEIAVMFQGLQQTLLNHSPSTESSPDVTAT